MHDQKLAILLLRMMMLFWNQSKFSNIWAIQYGTSNTSDEVEYRDGTPHSAYDSSVLGDINDFITKMGFSSFSKVTI